MSVKIEHAFCRRHLDIFLIFASPESVQSFQYYFNISYIGAPFTFGFSGQHWSCVEFLTSIYRKPTLTGVITNHGNSFPPYKQGGLHWSFSYISEYFIVKLIIWRNILWTWLIILLSHSSITCIHLKILFWTYVKVKLSLRCRLQ